MWDVGSMLLCPYCHNELLDLRCVACDRIYRRTEDLLYMYDPREEHWKKCQAQLDALFRLEPRDAPASHDTIGYPYVDLANAALPQKANAGMFNVCLDMIGERLYEPDSLLLVGGAFRGWAALYFASYSRVIAMDISDHRCFGMGSVPTDLGYGICKIIADCCVTPLPDESVAVVFMCSTFHHLHNKVQGLNEVHRVLKSGGCFVAMGDRPTNEENILSVLNDGIRDYEGPPYTEKDMLAWFDESIFDDITLFYITYSEHMESLGFFSLVRPDGAGAIIYGVKN